MLARRADADAVVLDDVADAKPVAGRGAEAKVPQRRVAAVAAVLRMVVFMRSQPASLKRAGM